MRRSHLGSMLAVLLMLAVVAGCGGNGGSGDTAAEGERALDRCSLVTPDEAGQWIGAPVSADNAEGIDGNPDPVTCLYEGASAIVLVQVYDGEVYFAEPGSAARVGEDVDGLGEDAFTDGEAVRFLQDGWAASVARISGQVDPNSLLEMAQLMSSRLP